MAPEVFERSYSELCDVWSLGLTIHEIVCGTPYFSDVVESKVEHLVCSFAIKLDQMPGPEMTPKKRLYIKQNTCGDMSEDVLGFKQLSLWISEFGG